MAFVLEGPGWRKDMSWNFPRSGRPLRAALTSAIIALLTGHAVAQADYPIRPIRLVVPFAAGGATDMVARTMGAEMGKLLHQPVVVDNKAGAAGAIGTDAVAKSAPDGYTVCFCTTGPQVVLPYLTKLPFDSQKDLVPVVHVHNVPLVLLARPSLPVANVKELIALAKAQPGKLTYGTPGQGGPHHLAGEMFLRQAGISMTQVPYKGENPAFVDLIGGQIDTMYGSISVALPMIKAGKMKALAVTGLQSSPDLPGVPTIDTTVPGFSAYTFVGLNVPAGTPKTVIDKLNRVVNQILADPSTREKLLAQFVEPVGGTPEDYAEFLRRESEKWGRVVRQANVTLSE
jgi:tripartite-type tricarboxylate transporter receptor subunit TctC